MLGKLIKSNFKKDFSHMMTFFLIMVLSVVLLHSGIMILIGYGKLFDIKKEELILLVLIVLFLNIKNGMKGIILRIYF